MISTVDSDRLELLGHYAGELKAAMEDSDWPAAELLCDIIIQRLNEWKELEAKNGSFLT